jgi:GDP-4-dehydro-6-deoxy-D-mannose reductase
MNHSTKVLTQKKVLITGINGFVGQHMGNYLLSKKNCNVIGIGRSLSPKLQHNLLHYESCDLLDPTLIGGLLHQHQPNYVIHLAAENNVEKSWENPSTTFTTNVLGTLHLLEALRQNNGTQLKGILISGSAQEYDMTAPSPLSEDSPLRPTNPYGGSKELQTKLAKLYATLYSLPIIVARTFNLIGPGFNNGVALKIAQQMIEIEYGKAPAMIKMGNLKIKRDFLDVRDAVKAYWLLLHLQTLKNGNVYNISRGKAISIESLLHSFIKHSKVNPTIIQDPDFFRKNDPLVICGNNHKLINDTGWRATKTLDQSVKDMLDYYR